MTDHAFVTRERELAELEACLERALVGRGQVRFVVGDAGSGKSALVAEFARRAQERHPDLLVAVGNCDAQTGLGDPYLPLREVLSLLTGDVEPKLAQGAITEENAKRLRSFFARSGQILIELGPDLVNVLVPGSRLFFLAGKVIAEKVGWVDKLEQLVKKKKKAAIEQSHIFEQVTRVLQGLATKQPLIVVVEDLQWADPASIGLLFRLARRIDESSILLIGTYRPADVALGRKGERHPLDGVVNELQRYYGDLQIDLSRAIADEGRAFVEAFLDTEPNRLGDDFRQALFRHTGGHPLFTVELLRSLQERGDLVRDEAGRWVVGATLDWDDLPARVESVIAERVSRLDGVSRETLVVASVEGDHFTAEVVARVQGLDAQQVVRRLSGELERRHRLVQAEGMRRTAEHRLSLYRFWHNLVRTYLYDSLSEAERVYLHEDVGNVLEALYGARTEEIAVQLAFHFETAGVLEKAFGYLRQAGERAQSLHAPHEAVQYFTRALQTADELGVSPSLDLYRHRGRTYQTLGDFDAARADYEAMLELARQRGERQAEWQALLDLGSLWTSRDYERAGEYYRQALAQARALGDSTTIGHSLNRVGNWHVNAEQPRQALRHHEEAHAIFERLGDDHSLAETLDLLGLASALGGDLIQSAAYYERAVALFRQLDDPEGLASSLASLMGGWDYASQTLVLPPISGADCDRAGTEALALVRELNHRSGEAFVLFSLSFCLGPQGEYARALRHAQKSLEIASEIDHRQWMTGAHCALGALYLDLLALPEARLHLDHALALAREIGSLFWERSAAAFMAIAATQQGELALAEDVLTAVIEDETPFETMAQRLAWCARAKLALAQRDAGRALQIVDRLVATAVNGSPGTVIPYLSELRGECLAALSRREKALVEMQAALEVARAQGMRPLLWRIHVALGSLYRVMGHPDLAAGEFSAAQDLAEELSVGLPDEALRKAFLHGVSEPPFARETAPVVMME